ncbi:hypothetical protein KGQ27_03150 [Patescibacteria group bacterium]|nr:hypothetical protein [Patescibacteria group bacterium]MDE1946737.1 hypothetical protein [Patescibacteria group bacterium]MDE2010960.1 hypothetical protein [Patescibacteria group bacterium]MDE2232802.1 hypothetical protein [Patescibacteria group bacterium]
MKKLLLFSWPIVAEKLFAGPMYYLGFPLTFHELGPWYGYAAITVVVWLLSVTFMIAYDRKSIDFLKVRDAREAAANFACRFTKRFFGRDYLKHADFIVTLIVMWQFFPPYSILARREKGRWGITYRELLLLTAVTLISNAYWTLVAYSEMFSVSGLWHLVKRLVS